MNEKKAIIPAGRSKGKAQIVTIGGGKGGIGKTFISTNLAVALQSKGYRVLIFDADLNLSNVHLLLNVDFNRSFGDFLKGIIPVKEVIQKGVGGVDILFAGEDFQSTRDVDDESLDTILSSLSHIEQEYDFIIVDTQAGLTELNQRLLQHSDRNILVTTPEVTALVDLYKVIKTTSSDTSGMRFDIVVNRVVHMEHASRVYQKIFQTISQFRIRSSLSLLGFIVDDQKRVVESIQKRIPIVLLHEKSSIAECIRIISHALLGRTGKARKIPFFFQLLDR